jgi:hypothetical protein
MRDALDDGIAYYPNGFTRLGCDVPKVRML